MVWPILSIQGFYISSRQTVTYFVFEKLFKKVWSRSNMFWIILSFQRLHNVFIKGLHIFFLFQIYLRNLNQGKYFQGFYISFHQKLIFFSYLKYFLQNSNFRIIRFDPSCPFKKILIILLQKAHWMWPDSTRISVKIQSGSTHIAFLDYSDRDNMVKLVLFFQVILSKRQYSSNHIVF